ncbi:sulfite exporter TauE/SafE family protein [Salsuginibacillus kocurii]|uniref:sulfite exporter TauE/SafE family protein n=1 Tax=Salsuginibacillus kocurii TaxID=427078 RepID=UPI00036633D6|nr:sulfite exporter TauE/SafE family protein [Salsuginibacillus kocurii]
MEWILLIFIGLAAGMLGSLLGLGGGIIIVPALMMLRAYTELLSGITPQLAVGVSLVIMVFTGLSSTLAYIKQKKVDFIAAWIFFAGSGPGALIGVYLNQGLEVEPFLIYFGLFMIVVSFVLLIRHLLRPLKVSKNGIRRSYINTLNEHVEYGFSPVIGIAIAFFVGMLSGLFGIGGGSLMVPAMILLFGFPPHLAVATSMFMILLSAIVSSVSHIILGNVEWLYVLALVPGAWFGAKLGAIINEQLKSDKLIFLLRIFLIIAGIRLIWQGLTGS